MTAAQTWLLVGLILFALATLAFLIWNLATAIDDWDRNRQLSRLSKDIINCLKLTTPSLDDIKKLAVFHKIPPEAISPALVSSFHETITNKEHYSEAYKNAIQGWIQELEKESPFHGLPSDIRSNMEKIMSLSPETEEPLSRVAQDLRQLISTNTRQRKVERWLTILGFIITVIAFGYSIYSNRNSTPNPAGTPSTQPTPHLAAPIPGHP